MASNILIVEPDPSMSEAMCKQLRSFGFRVESTDSIANAAKIGALLHPDLIVVDHCLADLNATEDPRRGMRWIRDAALVLVAEKTDDRAAASAEYMGASSLLTQPLSGDDLLNSVSHALWSAQEVANDPDW